MAEAVAEPSVNQGDRIGRPVPRQRDLDMDKQQRSHGGSSITQKRLVLAFIAAV